MPKRPNDAVDQQPRTRSKVRRHDYRNNKVDDALRPVERAESGEPATKRKRMQLGLTTHAYTGTSVAQRLKQTSLKDGHPSVVSPTPPSAPSTAGAALSPAPNTKTSPHNNHANNGTATNGCAAGKKTGKKALTQIQQNSVRVIAQYLRDLGLNETVDTLVQESKCKVESNHAARLRDCLRSGNWNDALTIIASSYSILKPEQLRLARSAVLEEKFYDLINKNQRTLALRLLREDYPKDKDSLKKRTAMMRMIYMDMRELSRYPELARYQWSKEKKSRYDRRRIAKRMQKILPPSFMLPSRRFEEILELAFKQQVSKCPNHLRPGSSIEMDASNVFVNHVCPKTAKHVFHNTQIVKRNYEIRLLEFSPCGKYLATATYMTDIIVYKMDHRTMSMQPYKKLHYRDSDTFPGCASWSTDSLLLAVGTIDDHHHNTRSIFHHRLIIFNTQEGKVQRVLNVNADCFYTTICFFRNKSHCLVAADMKGHMHVFVSDPDLFMVSEQDLDRTEERVVSKIDGYRMRAVYGMSDGRTILTADSHNRVRRYGHPREEETLFTESLQKENSIRSMTVHPNEKELLLVTSLHGMRLWSLETRTLLRTFIGVNHGEYMVSVVFGGPKSRFIATGGDDKMVYIYGMDDSRPMYKIQGHSRLVNFVSWCPRNPHLIASGSDDQEIRLWSARKAAPITLPTRRYNHSRREAHIPNVLAKLKKECTV